MEVNFEHTCLRGITRERADEIARYTSSDMVSERFRDPSTWRTLSHILRYHPSPIVRHEASFLVGELQIGDIMPWLVQIIKFDKSIVAKHEAAEALGRMRGTLAREALGFLKTFQNERVKYDEEVYHTDVQATIQQSVNDLTKYLAAT